LGCSSRRGRNC